MKNISDNLVNDNTINIFENIKEIQLFSRFETSKILSIGISNLDKIPESKLRKTRIGKCIRYSWKSINEFINLCTTEEPNEKQ